MKYKKPDFSKLPKIKNANIEPLAIAIYSWAYQLEKSGQDPVPLLFSLFVELVNFSPDAPERIDLVDGAFLRNRVVDIMRIENPALYKRYADYAKTVIDY